MADARVVLRNATIDDVPLLRRWDDDPVVQAASGDDDGFDWEHEVPRSVPWRELLIAELDGVPIGFMQLIDAAEEETHYWGEVEPNLWAIDIWIGEAEHRGKGHGTEMMRQALDRCFARPGVVGVLIDPLLRNRDAIRFYERIGFRHVRVQWFDTDECAVMCFDRPGTVR